MLLAMVTRHFRQLWQVAELLGKKLAPSEIARQTGISPYFLKGVTAQARHFRRGELQRIFEKFYATDLALKSSGGKPAVLMERLIMEICGLSGK
jgi:DNA polymerase-3 subunit delta